MRRAISQQRSYRHYNTSFPEDLPFPPGHATRKMVSSLRTTRTPADLPVTVLGRPILAASNVEPSSFLASLQPGFSAGGQDNDAPGTTVMTDTQTLRVSTLTVEGGDLGDPAQAPATSTDFFADPTSMSTSVLLFPPGSAFGTTSEDLSTVDAAPTSTMILMSSPVSAFTLDTTSIPPAATSTFSSSTDPQPGGSACTTFSGYGIPACDKDPSCANAEDVDKGRRGKIAGIVVGVIAFILSLFAAYLLWRLWRKKTRRSNESGKHSVWHKITNSDGSASMDNTVPLSRQQRDSLDVYQGQPDLGEPGPAFIHEAANETSAGLTRAHSRSHSPRHLSGTTFSNWSSGHSHVPTDQTLHCDGMQPSRSKIGLALTRYSTSESQATVIGPHSPAKQVALPSKSPELMADEGCERYSSSSAQSDKLARMDDELVYIAKARTARRQSLTPRVINIVAAGNSDEKINSGDEHDDDVDLSRENLRRESLRSRSMSPAKLLSSYSNWLPEPANERLAQRSSENITNKDAVVQATVQTDHSTIQKASALNTAVRPIIPERGRSMKRAADEYISYPPSSYPKLGKTMSEVKKTIREKGDSAFVDSENLRPVSKDQELSGPRIGLPSSVTVQRGSAHV